jgi:SAM-dependent methyltransferase
MLYGHSQGACVTAVGETIYEFHRVTHCAMCGSTETKTLGRRLDRRQGLRPVKLAGALTTVQRCRNCGLVFSNPMPIPANLDTHYDVPVGDYWQDRVDTASPNKYFAAQIARFRDLWPGDDRATTVALDIGAGMGKAMASLTRAGFDAYGIEPSASFREFAIAQNELSPDRIRLTGVEDADFTDNSFDFVTFGAVLEHLPQPAEALTKAIGWARPGGLIHVEVPSSDWLMARLVDSAYRLQGLDYTCHLSPLHVPYHLYEFTPESFEAFASQAGCEVAFRHMYVGATYAPRRLRPMLARVMAATGTGMQLEVWLRKTQSP